MLLLEPKGPRVRPVGRIRDHEVPSEAPDDCDDGVDDKEPPAKPSVPSLINGKAASSPPAGQAVSAAQSVYNGGLHGARHHLPNGLARVVEANALGHLNRSVPVH